MLKRRCRNHRIGTVITESGAQLGPTSGYLQIKGRNPFAVESQHRSPDYRGFCKPFTSARYRCLSGVPQWLRITGDRVSRDGSRIGAVALIRDRKRKRDRSESGGQIPAGDRVWIDGRTMQPEPPPRRPVHRNLRVSTSWGLASNLFSGRKTESAR